MQVLAPALLGALALPAAAQETQNADGSTTIDILATADELYGPPPPMEDCSAEQEAAMISGEIIVCRRTRDRRQYRTRSPDDAQARYAAETMNKDNPQTPDVAGAGIFRGPATVGGLCIIPPCPSPPAYMIDFSALPETPPGSDAERVGQGLAPRGSDGEEDVSP